MSDVRLLSSYMFALVSAAASAAAAQDQTVAVRLTGPLTSQSVDKAIADLNAASGKQVTLIVTSQGGDVASALRLGDAVHSLGADVTVETVCMSSCANYVFAAGKEKRILPGALVVWHGSVLQRDFRERVQRYEALLGFAKERELSPAEAQEMKALEVDAPFLKSIQQTQAQFFARVGVDERITRLGQEPQQIAENWTVGVSTMDLFGLRRVFAPNDYGTLAYQSPWQSLLRVTCLAVANVGDSLQIERCS